MKPRVPAKRTRKKKGESIMSTATINGRTSKGEAETDIRTLIESIHKAHHSKDAVAIAAPYSHDAIIFDLAPPLSHRGVDPKVKKAWLDTWEGPVDYDARDLDVTVTGDSAWGYGYYRLSGTPRAAGRPVSFWMRATVCLSRDSGGAWRIVHEHTSVPFYMDGSLRPAFDLKP
jgi:ketosteroid isomerase-like protein